MPTDFLAYVTNNHVRGFPAGAFAQGCRFIKRTEDFNQWRYIQ